MERTPKMSNYLLDELFSQNKHGQLEFRPADLNEAEHVFHSLLREIEYYAGMIQEEKAIINNYTPMYEKISAPISKEDYLKIFNNLVNEEKSKIEIFKQREKNFQEKFEIVKEWFIETQNPIPGSEKYKSQKESLKQYIKNLRNKIRNQRKNPTKKQKLKNLVDQARNDVADEETVTKWKQKIYHEITPDGTRSKYLHDLYEEYKAIGLEFSTGGMSWYKNPDYDRRRGRPSDK